MLRSDGLLTREAISELNKRAREAIFPSHDSEIGFARTQAHVVHGVVTARALAQRECLCLKCDKIVGLWVLCLLDEWGFICNLYVGR